LDAITGKLSYDLSNGAVVKSNLDPSMTYQISYWLKSGGNANISGSTSNAKKIDRSGWQYWEALISGATEVNISGNGIIDEVRIYPRNAQMTTYTYAPLIGMTSQCDINSNITYYEYDVLNRLAIIRDQDRNILKRICYNYAGQEESCGVNTVPAWQSQVRQGASPAPRIIVIPAISRNMKKRITIPIAFLTILPDGYRMA